MGGGAKGGFTKKQYKGGWGGVGLHKKGGLGQFVDLREGLARKRRWCFGGVGRVDTPIHTMKPGSFQFYRNALTHSTQSNCSIHFLTRNFKTKFFTDICIFRKMITLRSSSSTYFHE